MNTACCTTLKTEKLKQNKGYITKSPKVLIEAKLGLKVKTLRGKNYRVFHKRLKNFWNIKKLNFSTFFQEG